ncbi:hypothetical protein LSTR_LSTR015589 [Laodelphax striatellus]|uniref:PABC domain-containing protein n=1 Tax=Laodelphax striatellus TaxID=195883 RepID=A0A482XFI5_LAOST|nr:hypothetical protein LSTR_LSTR015589 [Laodelphax striatellus]
MDLPPLFETRKVLLEHLSAKVQSLKSTLCTKDIAEELSQDLSNSEIILLLKNEEEFERRIDKTKTGQLLKKQSLGDDLFVAVSQIDSELCAQLTGMLLELDYATIQSLIDDPLHLKQAVRRAKQEYIKFTNGDLKDAFGEELFELVSERYADQQLASQLTGMLLELDATTLDQLISSPTELDEKLNAAYSCLMNSGEK